MPKRDYIDFQDRSVPLAYLITVRTYGTWLHGNERGSVHRTGDNRFGEPDSRGNLTLHFSDVAMRKGKPFILTKPARKIVNSAIKEVCAYRDIALYAGNVRSNHFHVVVAAKGSPERLMTSLKAYATRKLRLAGLIGSETKVWARHGSTRYLWHEGKLDQAIVYVHFEQGDHLE